MLLHIEGFEAGGTDSAAIRIYLQRKYTSTIGSYTIWQTGRFDSVALQLYGSNSFTMTVDDKQTIIIGFAFKTTTTDGNDCHLLQLKESGTNQISIRQQNSTTELQVLRGTTLLGTTSGLNLLANTWYYIEFKCTIDNTGSYELRVNNVNVLSNGSVDTQETANAYIDSACIICTSTGTPRYTFDDIYICDDTGSRNNDFLGNMKVVMIEPNAAGASAQFTPSAGANYECVDDGQTTDDDATYVEDDTTDQKDLYNYVDAASIGDIAGIEISTEARETDATDYTLKTVVKSDTTESDDLGQGLGSDYAIKTRIIEDDPHTSAQWTLSNLNAAQFGIKVG